uniref:Uncharacterized protein n=1 Tax=Ciona savignyi TaxID=51511 RepID=H2ZNS4_CIOSA
MYMDPWQPDAVSTNCIKNDASIGFEDTFSLPTKIDGRIHTNNDMYLNSLEAKLKQIQIANKKSLKANEMLQSLQSKKLHQYEELLTGHGISNKADPEDPFSIYEPESQTDSKYFEIRRKLYPEHQALSKVELLTLLDHDLLAAINNVDETSDKENNDR